MQDIQGIYLVSGSKNAIRPSKLAALSVANEFWRDGETVVSINSVKGDDRMSPSEIITAWREMRLPTPHAE